MVSCSENLNLNPRSALHVSFQTFPTVEFLFTSACPIYVRATIF